MGLNPFAGLVDNIHDSIEGTMKNNSSKILFGEVKSIDPLSIQIENTGDTLPSEAFYLLDAVLVKKVRMIVHRMHGKPKDIIFQGSANEVSNSLNALIFNLSGGSDSFALNFTSSQGSGGGSAVVDDETATFGVSGENFRQHLTMKEGGYSLALSDLSAIKTMQAMNYVLRLGDEISFKLEFTEYPENAPKIDEHTQNQTVVIEGIIWQGMRVGDVVQMTSHNYGQKYQISRIINRRLDDRENNYEQVWYADTRHNDVLS